MISYSIFLKFSTTKKHLKKKKKWRIRVLDLVVQSYEVITCLVHPSIIGKRHCSLKILTHRSNFLISLWERFLIVLLDKVFFFFLGTRNVRKILYISVHIIFVVSLLFIIKTRYIYIYVCMYVWIYIYIYIYFFFSHVYSQRHFVHYAFSHGTSFGFYSLPNNDKRIVHRIFSGPLCSDVWTLWLWLFNIRVLSSILI